MPSMKAIKRRITSVHSTQQIMKAMDLVAAAKLQKAKERLDFVRPLYSNIKTVMDGIHSSADELSNIYLEKRDVKNIAYVVITSDRGLCGGYNINVAKETLAFINGRAEKKEKIITIGSKGLEYLRRRGKNILEKYNSMSEAAPYEDAERIGSLLVSMYTAGEVDEVYVAYTHFESILSHVPSIVRILPVGAGSDEPGDNDLMAYEPDIETFMSYAIPMYLNTFIYGAMVESAVCEHASRMTSMDSATRNAEEIIDDLTLMFNRKRQGQITQEITEIVSGSKNLK
jgi:F-type H+-transporting ATPase subunit gamma